MRQSPVDESTVVRAAVSRATRTRRSPSSMRVPPSTGRVPERPAAQAAAASAAAASSPLRHRDAQRTLQPFESAVDLAIAMSSRHEGGLEGRGRQVHTPLQGRMKEAAEERDI